MEHKVRNRNKSYTPAVSSDKLDNTFYTPTVSSVFSIRMNGHLLISGRYRPVLASTWFVVNEFVQLTNQCELLLICYRQIKLDFKNSFRNCTAVKSYMNCSVSDHC
jgi:hypothetical protein